MTTYSTIADGQIDQDSPITQPLMTALRDNPIAIAEGAAGAPKIADKVIYEDTAVSSWVTVTGLGDFSGCFVDIYFSISAGPASSTDFDFEVSDDGSTWYGTTTLSSVSGTVDDSRSKSGFIKLFFDFSSGALKYIGSTGGFEATVTGASSSITAIRFSRDNATIVMVQPQGGLAT